MACSLHWTRPRHPWRYRIRRWPNLVTRQCRSGTAGRDVPAMRIETARRVYATACDEPIRKTETLVSSCPACSLSEARPPTPAEPAPRSDASPDPFAPPPYSPVRCPWTVSNLPVVSVRGGKERTGRVVSAQPRAWHRSRRRADRLRTGRAIASGDDRARMPGPVYGLALRGMAERPDRRTGGVERFECVAKTRPGLTGIVLLRSRQLNPDAGGWPVRIRSRPGRARPHRPPTSPIPHRSPANCRCASGKWRRPRRRSRS